MERIMRNRSIYLADTTWKFLEKHSMKNDRPVNWTVKNIIENWIKRNSNQSGARKQKI
jgi:predicted DNA-binding protein